MRALLCVIALAMIVACDKNATERSDTLSWLENTYNPHGTHAGHGSAGFYVQTGKTEQMASGSDETLTHAGCHLTLHENKIGELNKPLNLTLIYTFNLRDIDPKFEVIYETHFGLGECNVEHGATIDVGACDHASIKLSTRNGADLVEIETHLVYEGRASGGKSKGDDVVITLDNVEYATRFARALSRAIELCGGKQLPF